MFKDMIECSLDAVRRQFYSVRHGAVSDARKLHILNNNDEFIAPMLAELNARLVKAKIANFDVVNLGVEPVQAVRVWDAGDADSLRSCRSTILGASKAEVA